jgi:hypothetical protein
MLEAKRDFMIIFPGLIWEAFVKTLMVASLVALTLVACSSTVPPTTISSPPAVTSTSILVPTLIPTSAPVPPTETPEAQLTSAWNGIPIMPGAVAGEGDEEGYVFTTRATPQQVQQYYQLELEKLGWQELAQEAGDLSTVLTFMNTASATLTISILSKDDKVLVLLVK